MVLDKTVKTSRKGSIRSDKPQTPERVVGNGFKPVLRAKRPERRS